MQRTLKSDSNCVVPCCPLKLPEAVDCRLPNDNEVAERERERERLAARRLFSFSSSQECEDCTRSRKCSDYSSTADVFLSLPSLSSRSAGVFCRRAKCERTNGSSERFLPSFLPFFCYAFEMPLTRDSTDRPNSLSVVRPSGLCILRLRLRRSLPLEIL